MKIFSVGTLGLSSSKLSMLRQAFSFAVLVKRTRAYELIEEIGDTFPDIFLVNIEDEQAVQEWQAYQADAKTANTPFAAVTTKIPKKAKYQIRLPFYANRVLKILDEISIKELGFVPELTIDDTKEEVSLLDIKTIEKPVADKPEPDQIVLSPSSRPQVLIADSNPSMQKILRLSLSLLKVDADCTDSGEAALELIRNNGYEAVFVEADLPGMDGYQLCKAIRDDPGITDLPVIMLSGQNKALSAIRSKTAGCVATISRPISHKDLEAIIQEHIFSR